MRPTRPTSGPPRGTRRRQPARRPAWHELSLPRRLQRIWGIAALTGLGAFVIGLIAAGITEAVAPDEPFPGWVGVLLIGGCVIAGVSWAVWAVWSQFLDTTTPQADGTLHSTARLTLWAMGALGIGLFLLLGGVLPFFAVDDVTVDAMGDQADALAIALAIPAVLGAALVVVVLGGSAIAGAVALGGAKWWWVGVIFDIGFAVTVIGIYNGDGGWTFIGALILGLSIAGYSAALAVGVRAGRRDALEAQERRAALEHADD